MHKLRLLPFIPLLASFLVSGCALFQHGDDKNYTLCKSLQGQIQFGGNTTDAREAESAEVDKGRLQAAYEKLNCSQYQWFNF